MLTKYNDIGVNIISAMTSGGGIMKNSARSDFRRNVKEGKDTERAIAIDADKESFKKRGLSLDARLHVIEMSQVEEEKTNAAAQHSITNANAQQ